MASKTKQRILQAARLLFNEEGESNVAMVDIANALDISPGNLYYHYRGKEQLIPVLFDVFEADMAELLAAEALPDLADHWAYCFLLMELLYEYRFIHGLDSVRFDKSLSRRYARVIGLLGKQLDAMILQLQDGEVLEAEDMQLLSENISIFMYAWINHANFGGSPDSANKVLHEGVYRIFYQLAVVVADRSRFLDDCRALMRSALRYDS